MIQSALQELWDELPDGTKLVAISKYHPYSAIEEAYACGQRIFGENHVQELVQKESALPKDIEWHFTGHLQTNKVKYIAPFISLIHSADSIKLLREIDKQGRRVGRRIRCLLELHIAAEETKYGFSPSDVRDLYSGNLLSELENVEVCGLMCMGTNTDDTNRIHTDFATAKSLFDEIRGKYYSDGSSFNELSMGMSDDYKIALEHGSTMVRIGTRIFGEREY